MTCAVLLVCAFVCLYSKRARVCISVYIHIFVYICMCVCMFAGASFIQWLSDRQKTHTSSAHAVPSTWPESNEHRRHIHASTTSSISKISLRARRAQRFASLRQLLLFHRTSSVSCVLWKYRRVLANQTTRKIGFFIRITFDVKCIIPFSVIIYMYLFKNCACALLLLIHKSSCSTCLHFSALFH